MFLVITGGGPRNNSQSNISQIEDIDYELAIKEMQTIHLDRSRIIGADNEE